MAEINLIGSVKKMFLDIKGHPHASIMYPRFWAEFLAV